VLRRFLFLVVTCVVIATASRARAANDPTLVWKTLHTKHFRITYYSGEAEIAKHVADLAEAIHARLAPAVGWEPTQVTEVVLTDYTDSANGSAGALPYNQVHLYVTAPDDLSPLGDVDDWYLELLTHEYTHILHTDHIVGIPALVNAVLGKTMAPNQVQPHWLLEGLAVFEESSKTSGGRLRSSQWNMYMRADVLENNVAPLDQFSNTPRRWPQGNLWYLYGSFFLRWIAETYGEQAIRTMIDDYGSQIIPFAVNRSIRRATGRTYEELFPAWIDSLRRSFGEQVAAIRARGIREGVRVTTTGYTAQKPRFIPNAGWPGRGGDLLYYVDDSHTTAGLYRVPLVRDPSGRVVGSREKDRELLIRTNGTSTAAFEPNGNIVFNQNDVWKNFYFYNDLFEMPAGRRSESGLDSLRTRLTVGWRAIDPDVSPDGRRVAFVTNHRGTQTLRIADLSPTGISNARVLVPSARFDQAFAPRWSPDNRHVAYSAWTHGGYRDIRIVDTQDGSFVAVTHDRAIDGGPAYSHDGRWLFFHSDRTGVMNVYAYEVATGRLRQVTNVTSGAYQPEPSSDGKNLLYLGYTHAGFDIYAMPLDESQWLEALPYAESRPDPPPPPKHIDTVAKDYNPLATLRPRKYSVQITPGNFGQASIVTTNGGDIAGLHAFAASITTEWERPEFQGDLQYVYSRLPVDLTAHLYRNIQPRGGYQLGPDYRPTWIEETVGLDTGIGYTMPRAFDSQSFALNYSAARIAGELPIPADKLDPYETPAVPTRGLLTSVHLGWSYSNAQGYLWSVGAERGFSVGANLDISDHAIASDFNGYAASFNFQTYFLMPWFRHHVVAFHAGGGTAGGNFGGRGAFYVGGFIDEPVIDTVRNYLVQGGIQLRGYPVVAEVGRNYGLLNAEYRFPIVNVDRGPSTLPIFLQRVSGAAYVDYGSAFDTANTAEFKTGVGGELWFDFTLGYIENFTFRLGHAKGLASGGIDKTYFLAAIPF
jgi:hypothetical protein